MFSGGRILISNLRFETSDAPVKPCCLRYEDGTRKTNTGMWGTIVENRNSRPYIPAQTQVNDSDNVKEPGVEVSGEFVKEVAGDQTE